MWDKVFKIECELFEVECEAYENKNTKLALRIEEVRKKLWEVIKSDLIKSDS